MEQHGAEAARLRPYVAGLAVEWLRANPQVRHRGVEGSLAFVDISGFTALTERLATRGKVGAEEMAELLDATFVTLLEQAYEYGASLVKWGGDAVLLLFQDEEHAALACRAAYELRRTMRRVGRLRTSVGVVQLKMSVGISSGAFDFFLVGERHRELLVTGPAASSAAEMEQTAQAGEVVLSAATAALLPSRCVGAAAGDGFLLATPPQVDRRSRYWPPAAGVDIGELLDPSLAEHLLLDVGESEHRQVAVGFVEVSGVDALIARQGPGAASVALHRLMTDVQSACAAHRVTFWESDISRDGFKVMLVAGAPRSSGRDEEAMLRATRAVLDAHAGPLRVRIGVNSGRVFTGGFGPRFRRTWSAKGDAINLAARVMGKADDGELLATEALLDRAHSEVDATLLPPFLVKGKQHAVTAARVRSVGAARTDLTASEPLFVGRAEALDALGQLLCDLPAGQGAARLVVGGPGMGKTRLVDRAIASAACAADVVRVSADAYESSPYAVVRRLARSVLRVADDSTDDEVVSALRLLLPRRDPLLRWLPLLGTALGITLEPTAETAAVQGEFRRDRIAALVVDLLRRVVTRPTVLVVDAVDHADSASLDVLARLAAAAADSPWVVLLLARTAPAPLTEVRELSLAALTPAESRSLVLAITGRLAPHIVRSLVQRADGNPLFLRELATAAAGRDEDELPGSLEELLAGRIDDLDPKRRQLLRACSVLGVGFTEAALAEVLGEAVDAPTWRLVDDFVAPDGPGRRRFRSGLMRDAAYEGLSFRRRQELHARAASVLERDAAGGPAEIVAALSAHCQAAGRHRDAWDYSVRAGRQAQQLYANAEALDFYRRALTAARGLADLSAEDVAAVWEATGDAHARLAELEPALLAYREARSRAPRAESLLRARVAMSAGLATARAGQTGRSARWLGMAHREASAETGADFVALAAVVDVERAYLRHMAGRGSDAARLCARAIAQAEPVGADVVVGRALLLQDMVDLWAGRPGDEARVLRALALFERRDDLSRQAHAWNHLGMAAYFRGEWDLALERYRAALVAEERSGNDWAAAVVSANIGEILLDQGRLDEAEPLVAEALRVWRATTPTAIGFGAALLGRIAARRGRFDEALGLLEEARNGYAAMDELVELVGVDLAIAEALLLRGAPQAASQRLDALATRLRGSLRTQSTAVGAGLPATPHVAALLRLYGCTAVQLGDASGAEELLRGSVEIAREAASSHELALCLRARAWARGTTEDIEGDALLAELGVVALPELPRRVAPATHVVLPEPRRGEVVVDDPQKQLPTA